VSEIRKSKDVVFKPVGFYIAHKRKKPGLMIHE
jgi:hypothetical protein